MTPTERTEVAELIQATAGIVGRRLSDDVATAYVRALDDLAAEVVLRELRRFARTGESGTRFPTPAELRRRVGGPVTAPNAPLADAALDRVRHAVCTALAAWEQRGGAGSPRPIFTAVWLAARQREGGGGTVTQRERLWQDWLDGGRR